MKLVRTSISIMIALAALAVAAAAQDGQTQAQLASKTAKFDTVAKTDDAYKNAIDAHDLKAAAKLVGKDGSFRGTVTQAFTPRTGGVLILNFDREYKTAVTAVVKRSDFGRFPDLSTLVGKEIVVSGKFVDYKDATEIDLTHPDQIKIVQ